MTPQVLGPVITLYVLAFLLSMIPWVCTVIISWGSDSWKEARQDAFDTFGWWLPLSAFVLGISAGLIWADSKLDVACRAQVAVDAGAVVDAGPREVPVTMFREPKCAALHDRSLLCDAADMERFTQECRRSVR